VPSTQSEQTGQSAQQQLIKLSQYNEKVISTAATILGVSENEVYNALNQGTVSLPGFAPLPVQSILDGQNIPHELVTENLTSIIINYKKYQAALDQAMTELGQAPSTLKQ
jgi:hypothetical protein